MIPETSFAIGLCVFLLSYGYHGFSITDFGNIESKWWRAYFALWTVIGFTSMWTLAAHQLFAPASASRAVVLSSLGVYHIFVSLFTRLMRSNRHSALSFLLWACALPVCVAWLSSLIYGPTIAVVTSSLAFFHVLINDGVLFVILAL